MIHPLRGCAPTWCLLPLLLAAACGGDAPSNGPRRERDAAGIEWVRNSAPRWADTSGWRLVELRTIALPDSGPGMQLGPTAALLGDDGRLYVAGRDPMGVQIYDSTGHFLRAIGRNGGGPGEFRYIMLGLRHDTVLVQDPSLARLSRFGPDGALLDVTPSVCCLMGPLLPLSADDRIILPLPRGWKRGMLGGAMDSIGEPDVAPPGKTEWAFAVPGRAGEPASPTTVAIPFAPSREAAITPHGLVVWGTTDRYRLIVSRTGRDTLRVIEAPPGAPVPVADSLWRAALAEAREGGGVLAYAAPMAGLVRDGDIPRTRPSWSGLRVDAAGRLWVARPDSLGRVAAFDVFDSTGVLLGRVPSPNRRLLQGAWLADRVVLMDQTPDGEGVIRIFAIDTTAHR